MTHFQLAAFLNKLFVLCIYWFFIICIEWIVVSTCFWLTSNNEDKIFKLALHLLFPQFGLSGNNPQRSHTSQMLSDQSMNFILYLFFFFHWLFMELCSLVCPPWNGCEATWCVIYSIYLCASFNLIITVRFTLQCLTWEVAISVVWCPCSSNNNNMVHRHLVAWHRMLRIFNLGWWHFKTHNRITPISLNRDSKIRSD